MRGAISAIACVLLASFLAAPTRGGEPADTTCKIPEFPVPFIARSQGLVESGSDRREILDALTCIVKAQETTNGVGIRAVGALFHIANDNRVIRDYLLRIIADDGVNRGTRLRACDFLVYVADDAARQQLLRHLVRRWPDRAYGELGALIELGDPAVLRWLEATAAAPENAHMRQFLEGRADLVRVQQSTERLLTALQSDRDAYGRGWLVRQARRHGASRASIRNTVLFYLRRLAARDPDKLDRQSSLYGACDACGIFTDEDVEEFPAIRSYRNYRKLIVSEPLIADWATLIDAKRAEFYGLTR